jgi:arylsulfatase A-like enzyme
LRPVENRRRGEGNSLLMKSWIQRLTVACLLCLASSAHAAAPRPNIILIVSDDVGDSDIGCYGSEIAAPHLDGLAHGGVRFTQFYNTARCCPTRAALLTRLYQTSNESEPAPPTAHRPRHLPGCVVRRPRR